MFFQQDVDLLPQTFAQVILFETRLAIAAFVVFLVYHTHSLMCRMLGVPENWIKLVVKKIKRWFKL